MSIEGVLGWQARQDRNDELLDGIPVLPLKSMTGATQRDGDGFSEHEVEELDTAVELPVNAARLLLADVYEGVHEAQP